MTNVAPPIASMLVCVKRKYSSFPQILSKTTMVRACFPLSLLKTNFNR